jgi:hypothetical protein
MASSIDRRRTRRSTTALRALACGVLVTACASAARSGELEPRYVAVHNALSAMGLAQTGPIQQGSLAEGRDACVPLELAASCTTIVALGGDGVRDLDDTLLDAAGTPVAHDTTRDPQAVLRACVEQAGTYTLRVKMTEGAGSFLTATWSGGIAVPGTTAPAASAVAASTAAGTCDSPIPLTAGSVNGATSRGESDNEGSCANSSSRELVYKLDVASRQRVTIDVDPHFDAVLYVRKDDCGDAEGEVACNDDVGHQRKSRVDEVLEAGTYFVFVDGYSNEAGAFKMTVTLADIPTLAETCRQARPLTANVAVSGSTASTFDSVQSTCGDGAKGADAVFKLDLAQRARVRVTEHSDEFSPAVHLRKTCADEQTEVACSNDGMTDDDVAYTGLLDPGSYAVFADGTDREAQGKFTLLAETSPEHGAGTQGDACADALPLSKSDHIEGDTFTARDDVAGRCGGAGAADVVFRVDVARRARVSARFTKQEGRHVFVLTRACGDRTGEIACAPAIDELLTPGTYALTVDGATPEQFGKFAFDWRMRDVAGQEGACRGAPMLAAGQTVKGTTDGGGDNFNTSCGGREDTQANPDRVYRITLGSRAHVRLLLATPTWDGVLVIRKSCLEPPGASGARSAEVACNNDFEDAHHAKIDTTLDAGTYYVLVDGHATGNQGPFTLEYSVLR